jgi:hypothetical protein
MILSKVCFFPDKTEWCSFHKIPDFSSSHCVKGCFIEHLFGNAPICVSSILECNCCRIYRYVAAPKVRLCEGVTLQTLLGTKKNGNFHMGGGGASLSHAKPNLKDVLLFALWPLLAPTWQGRGRLNWRLYVYVPIVCCWEKMSGCTWHQDFTITLVWGPFYSFSWLMVEEQQHSISSI